MQVVISHAYTASIAAADQYIAMSEAFNPWLEAQQGFVSRTLVRSHDDSTHLVNIRVWRSIADYEAIIEHEEYRNHIAALSTLVDPDRYRDGYARMYADITTTTEQVCSSEF